MNFLRIIAFCLFLASSSNAQVTNPLQPFEFLVGGEWSTPTTVQTFEWGVGNQTVHSKLYFINATDTVLTGEISWFWHHGEEKIKGFGHLLSDQISFFDYSTEFTDSNRMNNSIVGYNQQGQALNIIESIEFLDTDEYRWTMYDRVLDELKPQLSITFTRKN